MGHKGSTSVGLISGAAIGAGLMYLADPDRGGGGGPPLYQQPERPRVR